MTMAYYVVISAFAFVTSLFDVLGKREGVQRSPVLFIYLIFLSFFVGLRYEVGKDWGQYSYLFNLIGSLRFIDGVVVTDWGFASLMWFSYQFGLGVSFVNFVCASILISGLWCFIKEMPYKWVAIGAAIPHVVTVMAMDHVRQATALGFVLLALAVLAERRLVLFFLLVLVGALFHRTAIIFFAFGLPLITARKAILIPGIFVVALFASYGLLVDRMEVYQDRYIDSDYGSRGAFVRVLLNAVPSVGFLLLSNRFAIEAPLERALRLMAWAGLIALIALPFSGSAIVVDRLVKYFMPVQFAFFACFISIFHGYFWRYFLSALVGGYFLFSQWYWLETSDLAQRHWLPYKSILH